MIISVRKLSRTIQMILWVCLFSFVLFKMLEVVNVWIQPVDKYREPKGDALKVDSQQFSDVSQTDLLRELSDRLRLFYFTGE